MGFGYFFPQKQLGHVGLWWPLWVQVGRVALVYSWLEAEAAQAAAQGGQPGSGCGIADRFASWLLGWSSPYH